MANPRQLIPTPGPPDIVQPVRLIWLVREPTTRKARGSHHVRGPVP